tara:strand:+ start:1711 stop:1917 length:207 start_codon:yes stop_codon:yes gene_type:complete
MTLEQINLELDEILSTLASKGEQYASIIIVESENYVSAANMFLIDCNDTTDIESECEELEQLLKLVRW